jgi:hypothetical protein
MASNPNTLAANARRPVVVGGHRPGPYNPVKTYAGALRYAEQMMPRDLRLAGFKASVFISDAEIHGGEWFRVSFGKVVNS